MSKKHIYIVFAQFLSMIIAFIEIPILAKSLGASNYGRIVFATGVATTASIFIEYGFGYSGARDIAVAKYSEERTKIVSQVMHAKMLLSPLPIIISLFFFSKVAGFDIYWICCLFVIIFSYGLSPSWYFVGTNRLLSVLILDVFVRIVQLSFIYVLVTGRENVGLALGIYALFSLINTTLPSLLMFKECGLKRQSFESTLNLIKNSTALFLFRGTQTLSTSISSNILGALSGSYAVAAFTPAEKVARSFFTVANTLINYLFPRFSVIINKNELQAFKEIKRLVYYSAIGGVVFCLLMSVSAEYFIKILFGDKFFNSISILQLFSWAIPARIITSTLSSLWLIPKKQENNCTKILVFNTAVVVLMAAFLVPKYGAIGMCFAFLSADLLSALLTLRIVKWFQY